MSSMIEQRYELGNHARGTYNESEQLRNRARHLMAFSSNGVERLKSRKFRGTLALKSARDQNQIGRGRRCSTVTFF